MTLDFEIKYAKAKEITLEDALANEDLVNSLNWLEEEGFIELEQGEDGQVRAYPVN